MATRTLNVVVAGDSKGIDRASRSAVGSLDRLDKSGTRTLSNLRKGFMLAGAAAGAAFAVGLKKSADAAIEAEKANARLRAQLVANGISFTDHEKQIQRVIDKHAQLSGFDDEDLGDSFTNIIRVVGNVNKALKLNAVAMDIARARHMDVAKAGELVGKVAGGNTGILSRYGIVIEKGATATEALAALQQKFSGQAEAYGKTTAGSVDRANVALENLGETIGSKASPLIADLAGKFSDLIRQYTLGEGPGGRIRDVVENVGGAARDAAVGVRSLFTGFQEGQGTIRSITASIGGLATGFLAFKAGGAIVAGLAAVKKGLEGVQAVNLATTRGALGAIGLAASALVGFLAVLSVKTRENVGSTEDFTRALREQEEAMRAVADIELDMAQRRANLRSSTVNVERAEQALADARREHGRKSLEAREAEANLRQARISQRRASVELARAEEDAQEVRRRGTEASKGAREEARKLNSAVDDGIRKRQEEVREINGSIEAVKQQGAQNNATRRTVERLRDRQRELNNQINALKSKKVDVQVDFKLTPAPGSSFGSGGIGDGVGASVQRLAQGAVSSGRLFPASGNLMGADPQMGIFSGLGSMFGLGVSSGLRPGAVTSSGNRSWHSSGEALDLSGPPNAMRGFFNYAKKAFGGRLAELIHTPGGAGIKNGRPYTYGGQVAADHYDHVHVAMDTGAPGQGDGIGQAVSAARGAGFRGQNLINAVAIAGAESGYSAGITNFSGADHSIGLWQINQLAHHGRFGSDAQLKNPATNARAAYKLFQESGFRPWSTWPSAARSYLARAKAAVQGSTRSVGGGNRSVGGGGSGTVHGSGNRASGIGSTEHGNIETPTGPGARLGMEGQLARVGVREARAQASDNLAKLIQARKQKRAILLKRLRVVSKALRGKMRKARRVRLLNEQAQLVEEIDALTESITEYEADQAGGATTITAAEALEAGINTNAPPVEPADNGAAALAAELAALRASIDASRKFAEQVQQTEAFQLKKYLADVLSGQIVGYGVVPRSFTPGSGVDYAY